MIVIVVNNGMYGTIRMHQEKHYPGRVSGTDLENPHFAAFARSFGAVGEIVEDTAQFAPALERAIASGKPGVIELRIDPQAITPNTTLDKLRAPGREEGLSMAGAAGVDAVLLDLGNVLVPIDFGRVFAHWGRVDGVAVERPPRALELGRALPRLRARPHRRGRVLRAPARPRLGLTQPDADMLAGWNAVFLEPHPDAAGLVEELSRRYPLYLFSNTNRAHQAWFTPRLESMLARFTDIYTSCDIGHRKPDVEAFRHVAGRMGVAPERIVFFDDMAENVEGARRAGLQAFQVTRGPEDIRSVLP